MDDLNDYTRAVVKMAKAKIQGLTASEIKELKIEYFNCPFFQAALKRHLLKLCDEFIAAHSELNCIDKS